MICIDSAWVQCNGLNYLGDLLLAYCKLVLVFDAGLTIIQSTESCVRSGERLYTDIARGHNTAEFSLLQRRKKS
jgi:hypothetical protein